MSPVLFITNSHNHKEDMFLFVLMCLHYWFSLNYKVFWLFLSSFNFSTSFCFYLTPMTAGFPMGPTQHKVSLAINSQTMTWISHRMVLDQMLLGFLFNHFGREKLLLYWSKWRQMVLVLFLWPSVLWRESYTKSTLLIQFLFLSRGKKMAKPKRSSQNQISSKIWLGKGEQ